MKQLIYIIMLVISVSIVSSIEDIKLFYDDFNDDTINTTTWFEIDSGFTYFNETNNSLHCKDYSGWDPLVLSHKNFSRADNLTLNFQINGTHIGFIGLYKDDTDASDLPYDPVHAISFAANNVVKIYECSEVYHNTNNDNWTLNKQFDVKITVDTNRGAQFYLRNTSVSNDYVLLYDTSINDTSCNNDSLKVGVAFTDSFGPPDFMIDNINLTQTRPILTENCTDHVYILNVSIKNEESTDSYIESTFNIFGELTNNIDNYIKNFTINLSSETNYSICMSPNYYNYTLDAYIKYETDNGYENRWYLTNVNIFNTTQILNLYNFDDTTGISELQGTLRDKSYNYYSQIVTKLQRYYITTNSWVTVQMDKSDDFGQVIFHVIEESEDYRFLFEEDGIEIDRTSDQIKFISCTSNLCELTFVVDKSTTSTSDNLLYSYAYDNTTEMFYLNWSDSSGLTQEVHLKVEKVTPITNLTICDTIISSSSGSINCNTSGYDGTLYARVYSEASPVLQTLVVLIDKVVDKFYNFGAIGKKEAGVWAIGFSITLVIGGALFSPVGAIVGYLLSLIIINAFNLLSFATIGFLGIVTAFSVLIMWLIQK